MDSTLLALAREARRLGLEGTPQPGQEAQLLEFARLILEELTAHGLIAGEERAECWEVRRSAAH
ncbi:hypothetical protein ACINK0_01260 [Deinococcus sp. VB343]|uniref:Uncharacterized protein n=1 Tax=Deinococcus sp. VB142 TaxID=3112952 RepID=A0AAU6Q0U0_9DEIO